MQFEYVVTFDEFKDAAPIVKSGIVTASNWHRAAREAVEEAESVLGVGQTPKRADISLTLLD